MYYLSTNKRTQFKFDQADDTLTDDKEESCLVNWKELSEEELNNILFFSSMLIEKRKNLLFSSSSESPFHRLHSKITF